jgi:hypothetical protein
MLHLTKAQQRARIREVLERQNDDDLAALQEEAQELALAALELDKQETGMSPGERVIDHLRYHANEAKVLDLPVRGRRLRDWLPPSYDEHVWNLRYGGHVEELHAELSQLGDIPLGAKLSIGRDWYEKCKAEEAWDSNDDTRVATLLMEAQLDMLERPFASIASLGAKPPTTRAERIEHLVDFFEMIVRGQRRLARMERLEEYQWGFIPAPPPQPTEGDDRASAADIYVPPALR